MSRFAVAPLLAAVVAALTTWLLIAGWLRFGSRSALLDSPHKRQAMHDLPVPRVGGLAMCLSCVLVLCGGVFAQAMPLGNTLAAALGIALALTLLSAFDDAKSLPVLPRLLLHLIAAIAAVILLLQTAAQSIEIPSVAFRWLMDPLGMSIVVIGIVWLANLFNFMDGSNGLLGGCAAVGFAALALTANTAGTVPGLCLTAAAIAGALVGFLPHNLPVARVFMGDAGAVPLGFLAAITGLYGNLKGVWSWWYPFAVFAPLIVDATYTLIKRTLAGKPPWQAHREHCYHRLIRQLGWTHAQVAGLYAGLCLIGAAFVAPAVRSTKNGTTALAIGIFTVITYALLLILLEKRLQIKRLQTRPLDQEKNLTDRQQ